LENPTGYGRILYDADRNVTAIVEEADAQDDQKRINVINAGTYCVKRIFLADALKQLRPDNAQGEFYLTDIIGIGYRAKKKIGVVVGDNPTEVLGVNTREDLDQVEAIMKASNRKSVDFM
jgi:bifunctional N-acetylglucosamine-1-phosphate-uridyltransferase/glucosamine-1-phosphate-acetyltransferase GlmU-like protein